MPCRANCSNSSHPTACSSRRLASPAHRSSCAIGSIPKNPPGSPSRSRRWPSCRCWAAWSECELDDRTGATSRPFYTVQPGAMNRAPTKDGTLETVQTDLRKGPVLGATSSGRTLPRRIEFRRSLYRADDARDHAHADDPRAARALGALCDGEPAVLDARFDHRLSDGPLWFRPDAPAARQARLVAGHRELYRKTARALRHADVLGAGRRRISADSDEDHRLVVGHSRRAMASVSRRDDRRPRQTRVTALRPDPSRP